MCMSPLNFGGCIFPLNSAHDAALPQGIHGARLAGLDPHLYS